MLPFNKDTLCVVGILVCIIGILYLFREVNKMKTSVVNRPPPQSVPFVQRVQTPVNDTPVAVPPPVPSSPAAQQPPAAPEQP